MLTERITARSIRAGNVIIANGCQYRAIADAERCGRGEVIIPVKVIRGNGSDYRVSRPQLSLAFGDMSPVDVYL